MGESKLVTFIGGFYIFGAAVVGLSLIFGGDSINTIFDISSSFPDQLTKLLVVLFFLPAGYLYLQRAKLGYWLVLVSAIVFFFISATLLTEQGTQPYVGNMLYALFVVVVTVIRRKEFVNSLGEIVSKKG